MNKKQVVTAVLHNGLGLVFPSEKPQRIEILSIFVMVSLESQATDAKQHSKIKTLCVILEKQPKTILNDKRRI